jgi:hypothetical protein
MNRRWLALFGALFTALVLLPMLRLYVLWPSSIGNAEAGLFWIYFTPPGLAFGGGSWNARKLHIASAVFYTLFSILASNGILWLQHSRKQRQEHS